jgi:glyoxylase-like metal-dependent hydrolase (beta-lactamase superfamily II)
MTQINLPDNAGAENARADQARDDKTRQIASDLAYRQIAIVNVVFYGQPNAGDGGWVLVDVGLPGSAADIRSAAQARFGGSGRPSAIVLTHGHFDHSPLFPTRPVDVSSRLRPLPDNGSVPGMSFWQWLHTPGHSPGHVSFWRPSDCLLIAGDAFITTRQESVYRAATQEPEMPGPPMYFTPDWQSAKQSVKTLASLSPETVVTGHGQAMMGPQTRAALDQLAARFDEVAIPQ